METKNRRKRINFSIKRQMQIRLFIKVLGIVIVGVGITAAVFYFYSDREITSSYRQFHVHANNFLDMLLPAVVFSLILGLLAAIVITLFLPVKIAGPLYRIEKDLKEKVSEGDFTVKFRLRKGDEVEDLAEAINECLEKSRQKIQSIKQSVENLDSAIKDTNGVVDPKVVEIVNTINSSLQQFKV